MVACGQPNKPPSQTATLSPPGEVTSSVGQTAGLKAEYFSTADFSGPSQRQTDRNIEFNWGQTAAVRGLNPSQLSARWTGQLSAPAAVCTACRSTRRAGRCGCCSTDKRFLALRPCRSRRANSTS